MHLHFDWRNPQAPNHQGLKNWTPAFCGASVGDRRRNSPHFFLEGNYGKMIPLLIQHGNMVWKILKKITKKGPPSNPRNLLATFDYPRVTMKSCGFCAPPGAPSERLAAISCAGAKPLWTTPTIQRFRTSSGKNPMVDQFFWIHFFPKFDFPAQVFAGVMTRHQIQGVEATAFWKNNSVYIYIIYIYIYTCIYIICI